MKAIARHYAEGLIAAHENGDKNAKELVRSLVGIMAKKRDTKMLKSILNSLVEKEGEAKGEVSIRIESAVEATPKLKEIFSQEAEKMYPSKKLQIEYKIIPSLLGGFRIRGKDKELDHSLATKLKKLRKNIS